MKKSFVLMLFMFIAIGLYGCNKDVETEIPTEEVPVITPEITQKPTEEETEVQYKVTFDYGNEQIIKYYPENSKIKKPEIDAYKEFLFLGWFEDDEEWDFKKDRVQNDVTLVAKWKTELVVGMECDYAPFNWTIEEANEYSYPIDNKPGFYVDGYDVQIAKKIASQFGLELKIVAIEWDYIVDAVLNDKIDLIIAGMTCTDSKDVLIDFTNQYHTMETVLLVKSDSDYSQYTSLIDFEGLRMAGMANTMYVDLVEQAVLEYECIAAEGEYLTIESLLEALDTDLTDAIITNIYEACEIVLNDPSYRMVRLDSDATFVTDEADVSVHIGVKEGSSLLAPVNQVLDEIHEVTRIEMMLEAYLRFNTDDSDLGDDFND